MYINVTIVIQDPLYPSFIQYEMFAKHVRVAKNQRRPEIKHIATGWVLRSMYGATKELGKTSY
jgi:hypothetical protein